MTAVQAADYLQVKEKTIRNWTSQGKIPSVKISGIVRYKKSEIDKVMEKKGNTRKS
jgi:excisionase family DNA binding protein